MLCYMHEGQPYGYLKVNLKVILPVNLASMTGLTLPVCERLLQELKEAGVFGVDGAGCMFSRRMIRDEETRAKRAAGGHYGGNPALIKGKKKVNLKDNHKVNLTTEDEDIEEDESKVLKKKYQKVEFDVGVKMTQQEWDTLVSDFGQEISKKSASFLSSYKIEKDYKTKSDYLTIRRWVIDAVKKHINGSSQTAIPARKGGRNQGTYDFINETAAEYFAIHGRTPEGEVQRTEDKGVVE